MSTTTKTSTSSTFAPSSMGTYNSLLSTAGPALQGNISNPTGNAFFTGSVGNLRGTTATMGANATAALNQRFSALGISPNSPAYNAQLGGIQRQSMANFGQGYNNLLLGAYGIRNQAINTAMNFRPLQTGGTQTQSVGGTGAWMSPLLAAGIGAGTSALSNRDSGGGFNYWAANNANPFAPQVNQASMDYSNMPNFGSGVDSNFGNPNGGSY